MVVDTTFRRAAPALGTFERYLTAWVALCIIAGIVLGQLLPEPFQALGRMTVAEVNIPVATLIWLMIVPMLLKVDFGVLHRVAEQWALPISGKSMRSRSPPGSVWTATYLPVAPPCK